jgi:hypothetical protein
MHRSAAQVQPKRTLEATCLRPNRLCYPALSTQIVLKAIDKKYIILLKPVV